jgi:hypothetical protein
MASVLLGVPSAKRKLGRRLIGVDVLLEVLTALFKIAHRLLP